MTVVEQLHLEKNLKQVEVQHFGEHLTIDGYLGDHDKLNDKSLVLHALNTLPELLGMKKLTTAEVHFAKGNDIKDPGGWSGFVVIEESHISIHTFPGTRFISVDVYTCRNGLDKPYILDFFKNTFDIEEFETNFIQRGKRYPGLQAAAR
ncbi:S-adenosylmethionine decarboxylase [Paraherbaspirillum soli]|uniref:S-adenosylmethionine decarboxylase n=1 Tax=Paraherbaspirillum soli TaxID=631222 RepID=A0ABW0MEC8_9BURK